MLENYIRPFYQKWFVDPFAKFLVHHLSPNNVTWLAAIIGILIAPALIVELNWLAILLLILSGFLDTLDGTIARLQKKHSAFGAMLDIVCDRIVEFAVVFGLFAVDPIHRGWLSISMLGSILLCITTFLVAGIFTKNNSQKSFYYSPGIMERAEAFIFFFLMILLPKYFQILASIFTFLVLLTAFIRMYEFKRSHEND